MELQTKLHLKNMDHNKEVVDRLVAENINGKLDTYFGKFDKKDLVTIIDLSLESNKKSLFNGILNVTIDGNLYRYAREDFKNLSDLINHLFDHLKQDLSNPKDLSKGKVGLPYHFAEQL